MLIDDAEAGGAKYNTHLYASYVDVFKESNNYENKEALWKHRWFSGKWFTWLKQWKLPIEQE